MTDAGHEGQSGELNVSREESSEFFFERGFVNEILNVSGLGSLKSSARGREINFFRASNTAIGN